jgi:hypothetical protein
MGNAGIVRAFLAHGQSNRPRAIIQEATAAGLSEG